MTRLLFTITLAIATVAQAAAQGTIGSLKIHPIFGNSVTKVIDTGDVVYYLSDHTLFSYDKDNDESDSYSRNNGLSDSHILDIYYNYDKDYLAVAYDNANIDILTADGATINLPDILNADLQQGQSINDITFAKGRMLVATNFGIVVYNDNRWEVEFSRIFNTEVYSVAATANYLWLNTGEIYYCSLANPAQTLADMHTAPLYENNVKLYPIAGSSSLSDAVMFMGGGLHRIHIDEAGQCQLTFVAPETLITLQPTRNGYLALNSARNKIIYLDNDGLLSSTYSLPAEMGETPHLFASMEETGSLWDLSTYGLRHIQIDPSGGMTVLSDYFRPNSSSVLHPFYMQYDSYNNSLLVSNSGQNGVYGTYNKDAAHIDRIADGWWENVTPDNFTFVNSESGGYLSSIQALELSPTTPDTYYIGTRFEGAYRIENGKVTLKYDPSNSPMTMELLENVQNVINISAIQFDAAGNMWMLQTSGVVQLLVLPSNKVASNSITSADWITVDAPLSSSMNFKSLMHITRRNDIKIIVDSQYGGSIYFINDNGNPASSAKTTSYASGRLYDQDGTSYDWRYIYCLTEDNNGNVWIGTFDGVAYFNPANAFSSNFSLTRPRIPRNDGTNFADNLLNGIQVSSIAVDGSNRKWIGTLSNGLYLVNENGSEVLKHYNKTNSNIPSNTIYSVCCSTGSNSVFVATEAGVVEIYSDASQPQDDYESVYAYPNPVRPEFTGTIAITGLMDNSLVKIADAAGNVVRSLQSLGGTATWDGNNASGKRVKTGVYYVIVSQSDGSNSSGKVATKILFIN